MISIELKTNNFRKQRYIHIEHYGCNDVLFLLYIHKQ